MMSRYDHLTRKEKLEVDLAHKMLDTVKWFLEEEERLPINEKSDLMRFRHIINYFLERDDIELSPCRYSALLHLTAKCGYDEAFKFFLGNTHFDIDFPISRGLAYMHIVAAVGTCGMVQALLDEGSDINVRAQRTITKFTHDGSISTITTYRGFTPLHYAAHTGNMNVIEMLLNKGADANTSSYRGSPLHFACGLATADEFGDEYHLLIKKNYTAEYLNEHEVHHVRVVRLLLDRGANIDEKDPKRGRTPLQVACYNGYFKTVEFLAERGADFNTRCRRGCTTLHYSFWYCDKSILKLSLEAGIDPNIRNNLDKSPFDILLRNDIPMFLDEIPFYPYQLLVKYGADINAQDSNGNTVLHKACSKYYPKAAKYILQLRANFNILNEEGLTPIDCCLKIPEDGDEAQLESRRLTLDIVYAYIVVALDKKANEELLNKVKGDAALTEVYDKYDQEIQILKGKIFGSSSISYFDLLKADEKQLAAFFRNKDIMSVLETENYKLKFPLYATYLEDCIKEGKIRRDLVQRDAAFLKKIIKKNLPLFIIDMIFKKLNIKDLETFEKAFQF